MLYIIVLCIQRVHIIMLKITPAAAHNDWQFHHHGSFLYYPHKILPFFLSAYNHMVTCERCPIQTVYNMHVYKSVLFSPEFQKSSTGGMGGVHITQVYAERLV